IKKAKQRGFVKAVAINTGLGLRVWIKEEQIMNADEMQKEINKNESLTLHDKLTTLFAKALQKVGDKVLIYTALQSSKEDLSKLYRSNDYHDKKTVISQLEVILNDGQSADL